MGLLAAACTAFYMTRLYILTFEGERAKDARIPASQVHESHWPMTVPLIVLAGLSIVALLYGIPMVHPSGSEEGHFEPVMGNYLKPVFFTAERLHSVADTFEVSHEGSLLFSWILAWVIALAASAAAVWAFTKYFPARAGQPAPAFAPKIRKATHEQFYVDWFYDRVFVRSFKLISFVFYKVVDALMIDTLMVRGTAWVTSRAGSVLRYFQTGDAQSYAAVMALALLGGVAYALLSVLR
jgi:NADH-quinone oxidoreductase subunit L